MNFYDAAADSIIQEFIDSGYRHMLDIPNNKVWVTESTTSTLVFHKKNVVIEFYFFHPSMETPMHSHPFHNKIIFLGGDLIGHKQNPNDPLSKTSVALGDSHKIKLGPMMPAGILHGFTTGPIGGNLYNIQIWEHDIEYPVSAGVEYQGISLGPVHQKLINERIESGLQGK
jgi:hypothetical protein